MRAAPTYYEVLGVTRSSGPAELIEAWRALSRELHPDKGGSAAEFAELSCAYATLRDPKARAKYDAELDLLTEPCPDCSGQGRVYRQRGFTAKVFVTCRQCGGTGRQQ